MFKKKGVNDSFRVSSGFFSVSGKKIRLPVIGWLRMREGLRFDGRIVSVTVSRRAGRWYASIVCELPDPAPHAPAGKEKIIGVDAGIFAQPKNLLGKPASLREFDEGIRV